MKKNVLKYALLGATLTAPTMGVNAQNQAQDVKNDAKTINISTETQSNKVWEYDDQYASADAMHPTKVYTGNAATFQFRFIDVGTSIAQSGVSLSSKLDQNMYVESAKSFLRHKAATINAHYMKSFETFAKMAEPRIDVTSKDYALKADSEHDMYKHATKAFLANLCITPNGKIGSTKAPLDANIMTGFSLINALDNGESLKEIAKETDSKSLRGKEVHQIISVLQENQTYAERNFFGMSTIELNNRTRGLGELVNDAPVFLPGQINGVYSRDVYVYGNRLESFEEKGEKRTVNSHVFANELKDKKLVAIQGFSSELAMSNFDAKSFEKQASDTSSVDMDAFAKFLDGQGKKVDLSTENGRQLALSAFCSLATPKEDGGISVVGKGCSEQVIGGFFAVANKDGGKLLKKVSPERNNEFNKASTQKMAKLTFDKYSAAKAQLAQKGKHR